MLDPEMQSLILIKQMREFAESNALYKFMGTQRIVGGEVKCDLRSKINKPTDIFLDEDFLSGILQKEQKSSSQSTTNEAQQITQEYSRKYSRILYEWMVIGGENEFKKFINVLEKNNTQEMLEYIKTAETGVEAAMQARFEVFSGILDSENPKQTLKERLEQHEQLLLKTTPNSIEYNKLKRTVDFLHIASEQKDLNSLKGIFSSKSQKQEWSTLVEFSRYFDQLRVEKASQAFSVVKFFTLLDRNKGMIDSVEANNNILKQRYIDESGNVGSLEDIVNMHVLVTAYKDPSLQKKLYILKEEIEEIAKKGGWISDQMSTKIKKVFTEVDNTKYVTSISNALNAKEKGNANELSKIDDTIKLNKLQSQNKSLLESIINIPMSLLNKTKKKVQEAKIILDRDNLVAAQEYILTGVRKFQMEYYQLSQKQKIEEHHPETKHQPRVKNLVKFFEDKKKNNHPTSWVEKTQAEDTNRKIVARKSV